MTRHPPISPLFPYTTLFRSRPRCPSRAVAREPTAPVSRTAATRSSSCGTAHGPPSRPHEEDLVAARSEEHTSELQSHVNLVCRLLLEKKKKKQNKNNQTHNT